MPDPNDIIVSRPDEFGNVAMESAPPVILVALRRGWLMLLLITLGAATVSVSAIWALLVAQYEVTALIHVAPVVRPILFADAETDISRQYRAYVATEAQAIVSPAVVEATLNRPEVRSLPSVLQSADAGEKLAKRLEVDHVSNTYTLSVSMAGESPKDMAVTINVLLEEYLLQREAKRRLWDEKILSSLRSVRASLEAQLEAKSAELRELAATYGVGSNDGPENTIDARVVDIHARLTEVRQRSALASAKLEVLDGDTDTDGFPELIPDGFDRFQMQDAEWQRIRRKIEFYENSALDDARLSRGADHPATRNRIEQLSSLKSLLQAREAELPTLYKADIRHRLEGERNDAGITAKILQAALDKLTEQMTDVARQAFLFSAVRHEQERLEVTLTLVLQKIMSVQVEQNRLARVTIDQPAVAPNAPNLDKRLKFTGVACLLSLFLGVGITVLREHFNTSFREPTEVTRQLGLPLLGCIQYVQGANGAGLLCDDRVQEPMRGISTALLTSPRSEPTRSRLITSPTAGCGKSSLALNMARSLASTGRRVLLVDADNRGQGITRSQNMTGRPGLLEFLEDTCSPEEAIYTVESRNLRILPAGKGSERFGEILSGRHVHGKLSLIFKDYDEVIVDSPPVLASSDAVLLATMVDDVILVLRASKSTRNEAIAAREYLATVGDKPAAVILNAIDPRSSPYHPYGGYAFAEHGEETGTQEVT